VECQNPRLDAGFRLVIAFIFFPAKRGILFFANALRLQQVQRQRNSHVKTLPAKAAAYGELQKSQTGNV